MLRVQVEVGRYPLRNVLRYAPRYELQRGPCLYGKFTDAMYSTVTGIGYAVAEGYAEAGASIALIYAAERPEMIRTAAEMAAHHGVLVMERRCDVSDAQQVESMISAVKE